MPGWCWVLGVGRERAEDSPFLQKAFLGCSPPPPVLQPSLGSPAVPAHSLVLCIPLSMLTGRIFPSEGPVLYPAQRL